METNFRVYFIKNTLSNYAFLFLKLLVGLVAVPVYLNVYGETQYGIFLLAFGLISSFTFFDFGSGKSLIRYTAEYKSQKDLSAYSEAYTNATLLVLLASVCIVCVFVLFALLSDVLFKIPDEHVSTARTIFYLAALASVFQFFGLIPSYILQGWGVFHKRNVYQLVTVIMQVFILLWVYKQQPSFIHFAAVYAASMLVTFLLDVLLVMQEKILHGVTLVMRISGAMFKSTSFRYTNEIFLLSLVAFFSSQADKLIVSAIAGVSAVTVYTIITKPYYICKSMFANYYAVLQPAFVHLHAKDDTIRVKNMIVNSTYIVVLVLWVILLCVATFFSELLTAWLGANTYTTYRLWGCLAMLNVFISALYGSIFRYLFVTGETKLLFGVDAVAVIINVFISILFTYLFDWYGVIIGTTVQMLILLLILNRHAKRRLQVAVFENITPTVIYFFLFSVIISAAIYWIHGTVEAPWGYLLLLQCCLLSISCFLVLKKEKLLHNLT